MCKVLNCAHEGCEAKVMEGRGYCSFHGGQIQYKKDLKSGKFKKPAPAPTQPAEQKPATPVKPNGQTINNPRFADLRKKQKIGSPGHGLRGLSKIDRERNHFSK